MPNYRQVAIRAARRYGIDPNIFVRQINQESGFNPNARSPAGAQGIAQIVPKYHPGVNPLDPVASLNYAARLDANNLRKYGNYRDALSVYNSGRPFSQGRGIPETSRYVASILGGGRSPGIGGSASFPLPAFGGTPLTRQQVTQPRDRTPIAQNLAQSLIQGFQSVGRGETPNYSEQYQLIAQLKAPESPGRPVTQASTGFPFPVEIQGRPDARSVRAVRLAQHYLGTPYHWGGESPKGFDCSGLLQYIYSKQGVQVPRTTYDQWKSGRSVGPQQLRPGDAVFFRGSDPRGGLPGHVGIYIGNGRFIEAPHTGAVVRISKLQGRSDYMGARRY